MSEETTTQDTGARPETPAVENRSFSDILKALIGKSVTVVNPESYETAPLGYKLAEGFYRGKVTTAGKDYLVLATVFERKKDVKEPVKQFIPAASIKRISLMPKETVLHL